MREHCLNVVTALALLLFGACQPNEDVTMSGESPRISASSGPNFARLQIKFPTKARATQIEVLNPFGIMEVTVPSGLICYAVSLKGVEAMHIYGRQEKARYPGVAAVLDSEDERFESERCVGKLEPGLLADLLANPEMYIVDAHHSEEDPPLEGTLELLDGPGE